MNEVIDVPDEAAIEEISSGLEAIENLQFIQKHVKKIRCN